MGLPMGRFHQFLTELPASNMIMVEYYTFMFLVWLKKSAISGVMFLDL